VVIATDLEPLEGELAISAITLAELHFGVLVAKQQKVRSERLRRLLVVQRKFDALPVGDVVAVSYGQLAAAVVDAGRRPRARSMDLWIAATAHALSHALYPQFRRLRWPRGPSRRRNSLIRRRRAPNGRRTLP
jgi:toxin FitB